MVHSWARHFTITLPLTTQEWEWEAKQGKPGKLLSVTL